MAQNIVDIPESADVQIAGWRMIIQNHKIQEFDKLFCKMMQIADDRNCTRKTLTEFEKYNISYETAIEYSADELENNMNTLAEVIHWYYNDDFIEKMGTNGKWDELLRFSKSNAGRNIADDIIDKIRNCENWEELYDEIHTGSKFNKDMKKTVMEAMRKWNRA